MERSKRGEKIAGGRLRRAPSGALSRPPPGPPFTGELGTKTRRKCTGAGWPLTPCLSPARCHCAAKPEGCLCYPFRRASPGASPWCGGCRTMQFLPCIIFSLSLVLRPQGVHPMGVPKWEPNGNPAQAISIGRGRVAEGASLALSGETSDLELTRTRLVGEEGDF